MLLSLFILIKFKSRVISFFHTFIFIFLEVMKIGVIGNGFIGKVTTQLRCKDIELLVYDINPEACEPKGL